MTAPAPVQPVAHTTADVLRSEFESARRELLHAKAARRVKDSLGNRDAVEKAQKRLNAVLDVYLDLR